MTAQKEELFNERLKDIFIGEELSGESGYVNLMNIKSRYFDDVPPTRVDDGRGREATIYAFAIQNLLNDDGVIAQ